MSSRLRFLGLSAAGLAFGLVAFFVVSGLAARALEPNTGGLSDVAPEPETVYPNF